MSSPAGLHRVLEPSGVLPQAAWRLDANPVIGADEVRIRVERLNLDAASFRQLSVKFGADGAKVRQEVLRIVAERGKMHNPDTGSGGMLIGTVEEVGPESPLGLSVGQRVATLVSLTLTPLVISDGLAGWDGLGEQVPAEGHAVLFARSIAAVLPDDLPADLALSVFDVCGAPALTSRVVSEFIADTGRAPHVVVLGAAGKSGALSLAAARATGAGRVTGLVPTPSEAKSLAESGLADAVVIADATDPVATAAAVEGVGALADVTVVCVDVPGCEHGAILATSNGGTVIFFSMATSFPAAALGAEGLAADVRMLIGNGFTPGHADLALRLVRSVPGVRAMFDRRLAETR